MLVLVACMGTATPQASFQQSGGKNIAVLYHLRGDGGGPAWTDGPGKILIHRRTKATQPRKSDQHGTLIRIEMH